MAKFAFGSQVYIEVCNVSYYFYNFIFFNITFFLKSILTYQTFYGFTFCTLNHSWHLVDDLLTAGSVWHQIGFWLKPKFPVKNDSLLNCKQNRNKMEGVL